MRKEQIKVRSSIETVGKPPPQAVDVEKIVLGNYIQQPGSYSLNPFAPEKFYLDQHQKICTIISEMSKTHQKIDLVTVCQKLKEKNLLDEIGGMSFVSDIFFQSTGSHHMEYYLLLLEEKYLRRELIRLSIEMQQSAYDEAQDLEVAIQEAQAIFMRLLNFDESMVKNFTEESVKIMDTMHHNASDEVVATGIPIGIQKLDEFTFGMQPTDLVLIAGESSHGKTTLALHAVINAAKQGYSIAVYSLEMTSSQLTGRILGIESGISSKKILFTKLAREEIIHVENHVQKLSGLPIYFDEKSNNNIQSICTSIRRMVLKYGIRLVVVDYLQLVNGDKSQGREEEVGQNARMFKNIAKELNIVVIVLSQLANNESHVPSVSRLRASGQIKEAADSIYLIWIPEIENIYTIEDAKSKVITQTAGKAEIIIGKGRNTGTAKTFVKLEKEICRISNLHESFTPTFYDEF